MRRNRAALALAALALALAPGCVMGRLYEGNSVRFEQLERLVPGETTRSQVLEWFGPPDDFSDPRIVESVLQASDLLPPEAVRIQFSDVLSYRYDEGKLRAVVLILFNHVDLRIRSDKVVIFFDQDDRVRYWGWRRETPSLH